MTRFILLVSLMLVAMPVGAQDMEQWEDYLRRGSEAYDEGDYQTALLLYGKAQRLEDAPMLRLQIADIHEKLGECNAARLIYTTILDDQKLVDTGAHQTAARRLDGLSMCGLAAASPTEPEPEVPAQTAPRPEVAPSPETLAPAGDVKRRLPRGRKTLGISVTALGGLSLTGGVLMMSAFFVPRDIKECLGLGANADCVALASRRGESERLAREHAERVRSAHVGGAITMLATGVIATGTGIVLLTTGRRPVVVVVPSVGGLQVLARF